MRCEVVTVERPVHRLGRGRLLLVEGGVGIGDVVGALGGQVYGEAPRRPRATAAPPATASLRRALQERQMSSMSAGEPSAKPVMVGNGSEGPINSPMPPPNAKIEPERLGERLAALPGIERLREAATPNAAYLVGGAVRDLLLGRRAGGHRRRRRGRGWTSWLGGSVGRRGRTSASTRRPCGSRGSRSTWRRRAARPTLVPARSPRFAPRRWPPTSPPRLHGQRDGGAAGRRSGADRSPSRPGGPAPGRAASAAPALVRGRPDARPASRAVRGALRVHARAAPPRS